MASSVLVKGDMVAVKAAARRVVAPVKSVPTFAELAGRITLPDGPKMGLVYDPSGDPVHAAVVKEMDSARWNRIVGVGAVQTGKSLLLVVLPLLRTTTYCRTHTVYAQPTMPKIHEAWSGKIKPMILSSELKGWMPLLGRGSRDSDTPPFVRFTEPETKSRAGILWFIAGGGSKEAAQAAVTAPTVLVDEVDSFQTRHRVELISKRADAYRRKALRIFTSTVKRDQGSIILGMYDDSTGSRLHFACPHCGTWHPLEWENVVYDREDDLTAQTSVRYVCAKCAVQWTEQERSKALKTWRLVHKGQTVDPHGRVVGPAPRTDTFGLLWTALDSTLRDLGTLALEHLRALRQLENGDHGPMRSFFRDQLCKMYVGEMEELESAGPLTWQYLASRSGKEKWGPARPITDRDPSAPEAYTYSRHVAVPPSEAQWSIGAVDVQHNRVYWILRALNRDETSWFYAWGYEYARPDHHPADRQELGALLRRTYSALRLYAGSTDLVLLGLDVGDQTEDLRQWVEATKGPWRACKGYTHHLKAEVSDIEGLCYWRDSLFLIAEAEARNLLHSTLRRPIDAPGATHFPVGIGSQDASLFRHLVSEQEGLDPKSKKRITVRGTGRNDWLDCAKMTEALMRGFILDFKAHEQKAPVTIRNERPAEAPVTVPAHADDEVQPMNPLRVRSPLQRNDGDRPATVFRTPRRYGGVGYQRRGW